nr:immunoglobulin heavy chain junction region [Mus musculus]
HISVLEGTPSGTGGTTL